MSYYFFLLWLFLTIGPRSESARQLKCFSWLINEKVWISQEFLSGIMNSSSNPANIQWCMCIFLIPECKKLFVWKKYLNICLKFLRLFNDFLTACFFVFPRLIELVFLLVIGVRFVNRSLDQSKRRKMNSLVSLQFC